MKARIVSIFFILLSFAGNGICDDDAVVLVGCGMPVPVERFINSFGADVHKRYKLELVAMNDRDQLGGSVIDLLFDYYGDMNLAKARELITTITDAFLDRIGRETALTDYFCHFPLELTDLSIKIRHRKPNCGFVYPSLANVEAVLLQDGRLYYETVNASTYAINILRTESYESAQQIVSYTSPANAPETPLIYNAIQKSL
jgi:hypothetical protein